MPKSPTEGRTVDLEQLRLDVPASRHDLLLAVTAILSAFPVPLHQDVTTIVLELRERMLAAREGPTP
jgi:hypothetical protein